MTDDTLIYWSFWIFGLVNNILYVVILSAAVDLAGAETPKAVILLADILPAFVLKVLAPLFIHQFPYKFRMIALVVLSTTGMLLIAFVPSFTFKICGVLLASTSSGLGEISFLALTHFYGRISLAGFGSGTGAAGLAGSFVYLALTTWLHLSIPLTLFIFSFVPLTFLFVYSKILPKGQYTLVTSEEELMPPAPATETALSSSASARSLFDMTQIIDTMHRVRKLVIPYMLPLSLVYMAEYIINQGVAPTLLFPLDQMPFAKYRDAYVTYSTLYQLGVFISRSSSRYVRLQKLYVPALLQLCNLGVAIAQAIYMRPIPNIYNVMGFMFWEGIIGGIAYINTFTEVLENMPHDSREFAMGAVGMSDSGGIVVAGLVSLWLEPRLCSYQVDHGRPWCTMT